MKRVAAIAGALLVTALLVVELAAVPVATRLLSDALANCLEHDELTIQRVDRPAVPRLLVGRATGVEMSASGLVLGGLRVEQAQLDVPLALLPWAPGSPDPREATLELDMFEDDLEAFLRDGAPRGLRPALDLQPGIARLGAPPLPLTVEVAVSVEDRIVRIAPAGEAPEWWDRLPIPERFELPEDLHLHDLEVHAGSVTATLVVDELPGIDGARECVGPLA